MYKVVQSGLRPGGIGFATAERLSVELGHAVYAIERDEAAGRAAAAELRRRGGRVELVRADLARPEDVGRAVNAVRDLSDGPVDALIVNHGHAGTPSEDNLSALTRERFVEMLDDNLVSAFLLTQAAERHLFPRRGGTCVYLSTNNGAIGSLGQLAYGVAKQALVALARGLAAEGAGRGRRYVVVSPGVIETDSPNWQARRRTDPDWARLEGLMSPAQRIGRPEDVAGLIAFLLDAPFINGTNIVIDGGLREAGLMLPCLDPTRARESYVRLARALTADGRKAA